jgi:hypothetical protein
LQTPSTGARRLDGDLRRDSPVLAWRRIVVSSAVNIRRIA